MSHFPGLVIVPSALTLGAVIAPYNEDQEVPRHLLATRAQVIEKGRRSIEEYRDGLYAEYLANPAEYARQHPMVPHVKYLAEEFPQKLAWTDDEVHADAIKWEETEDVDTDGNLYSTAPDTATWDWYTIGGRWSGNWGYDTFPNTITALAEFTDRLEPADSFAPRAIVTPDKGWIERGRMGWFGMSDDEHDVDQWRAVFLAALAEAASTFPSASASVVDFHI
jgi:hypothetical protein